MLEKKGKKEERASSGEEGQKQQDPQKDQLDDLICRLSANTEALDVARRCLRQSFTRRPPLQLDARRRSTYKRIETSDLHLSNAQQTHSMHSNAAEEEHVQKGREEEQE